MNNLKLFIPLTKVDEEKRMVYGIATAEQPDQSGEVCDYASTVPYYKAWSENIEKVTDGKSLGNLRAMHGNVAAGKVTQIMFNDDAKQIEICAKVVDDNEWKKVLEGVYTGFSQGGSYAKKWKDGDHTRYTADPAEISIVDNPCLPSATFTLLRAGGTEELVKFKATEALPEIELELAQVWKAHDGTTFAKKDEALRHNAEIKAALLLKSTGDKTNEILDELDKRHFSSEERDKMATAGTAMPDGSFPIANKEDLHNAIQAHGRAKDPDAAKKHIIQRAREMGATDMLPDDWKGSSDGDVNKAAIDELQKYNGCEIWDAQTAMSACTSIVQLLACEKAEPEKDKGQLSNLQGAIDKLKAFIASEIAEKPGDDAMAAAAKGDLEKLEKVATLETENEALKKQVAQHNSTLDLILARVKKLEAEPLPPAGKLYSVGKGHEVDTGTHNPNEAVYIPDSFGNGLSPADARQAHYFR